MDDEVKKIIGESYKRLPFDLKKTIVSSETRQRVQAVVERHQLYSDQADDLEMETTLVMLGLRPPTDFITNVKKALNVSEENPRHYQRPTTDNQQPATHNSNHTSYTGYPQTTYADCSKTTNSASTHN